MAEDVARDPSKILNQARDNFKDALDGWMGNRTEWADDLAFLEGDQWPTDIRADREKDGRPCLTINKLPSFVDQITGDQLQNRPQLKVTPVDDYADKPTAEIISGIIRNIERVSDAEVAYDTAFQAAAECGFGAWRILTDYIDSESFDQEILIERIANQFTVYPDPLANKIDYSDGRYMYVTEEIPQKVFEQMYPESTVNDWEEIPETLTDWITEEKVRVAEYWYKETKESKIYLVRGPDGNETIVPEIPSDEYDVVQSRTVENEEIWWLKTNGHEILEKPQKWAGDYFPIILVWGKERNLQGKKSYRGAIRDAKDPQRLYNYNRSLNAETTSLAPKAPYVMTPDQVSGHEHQWKTASKRNWPYLLYNPDMDKTVPPPQRQFPSQLSTAVQSEIIISDQEIHDTTGLQLASMGKASNERSGVAIQERKAEGDRGSYGYINSLGRAQKYQGKVLVNLIPKIYDTARIARIIGEDGKEKRVPVNQPFQTGATPEGSPIEAIYDLTVGRYDVAITIGPNFATQRQEAADSMMRFIKFAPQAGQVVMDLIAKYQDWPGAEEIEKRLRKILPPGMYEPEEGEPPIPPPPPSPQEQIELAKAQAELAKAQAQVQQEQIEVRIKELEVAIQEAKLRNEVLAPKADAA
jgi:hypothetical protein